MKKKLVLIFLIVVLALSLFACKDKETETISNIDYSMEISGTGNVYSINQSTKINNVYQDDLDHLIFNLYANAYSENAVNKAYSEKLTSYGGIKIDSVTIDGEACKYTFEEDNSFLNVAIPTLKLDKSITIAMTYTLTLPECNIRMGVNGDCTKLTNFYPQLAVYQDGKFRLDVCTTIGDPFFSEVANYEVTILSAEDSVIATSGTLVSENKTQKGVQSKYVAKNIRDFVLVIDKNLLIESTKLGDTEIMYYYYEDENPAATLKFAVDAITIFSEKFGVYPFETLSVVATDFDCAGMEYGRLVYVALDTVDIEDTIVHEIAHQWWYGLVGNDSINEAFLDEGLTTFSTLYYYKQIYGQEKYDLSVKAISDSYMLYERIQNMRKPDDDLSINKSIYDYTSYQYDMLVYKKGAMMFANLMETMGEEKFTKALNSYVKNNSYKIVNCDTLIKELNKAYGSDIGGLVNGWIGSYARITMLSQ